MVAFLPLLASLLLLAVAWRRRPDLRVAWLALGSFSLCLFPMDWLMLALLPRLRLSYGVVATPLTLIQFLRMGLVLAAAPILLRGRSRRSRGTVLVTFGILQAGTLALAFYGLYVEPFRLGVTRLPVPAPAFLPDRPLRILQISDLHVERITRRERDVLAQAETLQPDLIVLTGDYVNMDYLGDPQAWAEARDVLSGLHAPYGVYAVLGTTDLPEGVPFLFDGLDIRLLDDEVEVLSLPGGALALVGVTNSGAARDARVLEGLMADLPPADYTLLLYHTPDLVETAADRGVDLYLAGHTHGGQVRLPFYGAVITFSDYGKRFEMGEYHLGATTLYVSRGLGMEGFGMPRARFLCPPELVLVELGP
jgi:hypothetical protein